MRKLLISLIFGIFLISLTSAWTNSTFNNSLTTENISFGNVSERISLCYQEQTNSSSGVNGNCSLIYGGLYNTTVAGGALWADGNYATTDSPVSYRNYSVNYTKPGEFIGNATWQIKYLTSSGAATMNYTIPNSCLNYGANVSLWIFPYFGGASEKMNLSCFNSSGVSLFNITTDVTNGDIYEESIYWNTTSPIRYLPIPSTVALLTTARINFTGYPFTLNNYSVTGYNTNITNGAFMTGLWNNATDFYFVDPTGSGTVFRTNAAFNELSNFSLTACSNPIAIWGNGTDFYITNTGSGQNQVCRYSVAGSYLGGFNLSTGSATGGIWGNGTDFWIAAINPVVQLYRTGLTGTVISNFSTSSCGVLPYGVTGNGTDFWITNDNENICRINSTGSLVSSEIAGYNSQDYRGITGNGTDFWLLANIAGTSQDIFRVTKSSYPTNASVSIGSSNAWNYSGVLNTTNQTNNFAQSINNYLASCTYSGGYCYVPFVFSSYAMGILQYSNLNFNNNGFLENYQVYNTTARETTNQTFILNITYDNLAWSSAIGTFYYNGTAYSSITGNGTGGNVNFSKTIAVPAVTSTTNYTFYWSIGLTNSSGTYYYNATPYNQTVSNLTNIAVGTSCSAGLTAAFYFDFAQEANRTVMNNSVTYNLQYGVGNSSAKSVFGSLSNIPNFSICINASEDFYTVGYGEVQYGISGFVNRHFYIFSNTRATNVTVNNTLYDLDSASATAFQFTLTDTNLAPVSGDYIALLRWYPDINAYKIVEMGLTDSNGQTAFQVKTIDVDYRVAIYYPNGTLIQLFDPIRLICATSPCAYSITLPTTSINLVDFANVEYNLSYDNASSSFIYIWNDPSQTTTAMNLTVYSKGGVSTSVICTTQATGFTGILTCPIGSATGTFLAVAYRTDILSIPIASLLKTIQASLLDLTGGKTIVLFFGFIICVTLILIGAYVSPIMAIIFGVIALIPMMLLGGISYGAFIAVAILGGIVWHFMKKT